MDAITPHTEPVASPITRPGHPLRIWLAERNMRVLDFSRAHDLNHERISEIINWKVQPKLPMVIRLCELTGLSAKDFVKP